MDRQTRREGGRGEGPAPAGAPPPVLPRAVQGMALMLASALIFSINNVILKHATSLLPPVEIVFFRALFSYAILLPMAWRAGLHTLKTRRPWLHGLRGTLQAVSMMAFFSGIATTPLVEVNALEFTAPLWATLIALLVFREPIHWRRTAALVAGFAGALIALRPGFQAIETGQLLILSASVTWAGVILCMRELSKTETAVNQNAWSSLIITPVAGLSSIPLWVTPDLAALGWLAAITLGATLGQLAYVEAFRRAEMSAVLPLDFSKIVWASGLGFAVFGEVPDLFVFLGGAIIFAAGTYLTIRETRLARRQAAADAAAASQPPSAA